MDKPHCDRFIAFRPHPEGWGSVPVQCHVEVGLRTWIDTTGTVRRACAQHRASLERRYPAGEWTESELQMAWGK